MATDDRDATTAAADDWSLTISRVENGFIATDGIHTAVFEEPDECERPPDADALARLLWHVVEFFGGTGSKHDARRAHIKVVPGSDYNGPFKKRPN